MCNSTLISSCSPNLKFLFLNNFTWTSSSIHKFAELFFSTVSLLAVNFSSRPVCRHFMTPRGCERAQGCQFYHPGVNGPPLTEWDLATGEIRTEKNGAHWWQWPCEAWLPPCVWYQNSNGRQGVMAYSYTQVYDTRNEACVKNRLAPMMEVNYCIVIPTTPFWVLD